MIDLQPMIDLQTKYYSKTVCQYAISEGVIYYRRFPYDFWREYETDELAPASGLLIPLSKEECIRVIPEVMI